MTDTPQADAPIREFSVAYAPESGPQTWLGPSRNEFRFVGSGSITRDGLRLLVRGRRFGFFLGLPLLRRIEIEIAHVVNVEVEGNVVRLECRIDGKPTRSLTFWAVSAAEAAELVQLLPSARSPDFHPQLAAHLAFEERLQAGSPSLPVTYGVAVACVLMFIVTILNGAEWFKPTGIVQIRWGSNFGPSTIGGEWWRLLTSSLLHFGVLHLAFNLWALVSFGAIAERLYGSKRYALICVIAGLAGGMASVAVRPLINSAGASALIFGIFGALLVAHFRGTDAIPKSVGISLRNSTLLFASIVLIAGFVVPGIDNAAHVGGLVAGICVGLAFQSPIRFVRVAAPSILAGLVFIAGAGVARHASSVSGGEIQYWNAFRWFVVGEPAAVSNWSEVQKLARAKVADDVLADRIDRDILPFWREASSRLKPIKLKAGTEVFAAHQFLASLTEGRLHALELCASGLRKSDVAIVKTCMEEMGRGDQLIAERAKALKQAK
jgi:membrane associated rhomboid family serine protease